MAKCLSLSLKFYSQCCNEQGLPGDDEVTIYFCILVCIFNKFQILSLLR